MSKAALISPHLPYLRRFARALTGSQHSGDNYVAALLEVLIEGDAQLDDQGDTRVALYKMLVQMWSSLGVNLTQDNLGAVPGAAEKNLQAIAPLPRQAFLLTEVEGFDDSQVAEILDLDIGEVDPLLKEAAVEMAEQVATKVLIIEDEPLIAMDIEDMVRDLGHQVTSVARTHKEAISAIEADAPGIVLADIQLADGSSGVEAVNEILTHISVPVVFITAYPERLLTGDRPEPAYLVTKPFKPGMVAALISQALFFGESARDAA
jgi:DNA-directed RNA polymerase specialized sigma24 family protein